MNVSSAQQFLVVHTYKLCHTACICMKCKRHKKTFAPSTFLVAWLERATAVLNPCNRHFLLATKTCCMDLMGTCLRGMQMHIKWPESEMKDRIVTFIYFTEQHILSNLFIVQKNRKGGSASNCIFVLLFSDTTVYLRETTDNSIS